MAHSYGDLQIQACLRGFHSIMVRRVGWLGVVLWTVPSPNLNDIFIHSFALFL
jgi:hypothetical protein